MIAAFRWLKILAEISLFVVLVFLAFHYKTSVYLLQQASGQLGMLLSTTTQEAFIKQAHPSAEEVEHMLLAERVKRYSVDSLGYKPTTNFTRIYDQQGKPILWVITASKPYSLEPYEWQFPIVGQVSYKGFFRKELAQKEYNHLVCEGYDVDLRSVSAWSTLGWLSDPLLSSMLKRSKGSLCNLLFHELFHATCYIPGSVDFNENMASFVAHKATRRFLANDEKALADYDRSYSDNKVFDKYMLRSIERLKTCYKQIENDPQKQVLKLKFLYQLADSIDGLPLQAPAKFASRKKEILTYKNAYFVGFVQYDSMQDSLEEVFNKIYRGDLEKMVQDLRLN